MEPEQIESNGKWREKRNDESKHTATMADKYLQFKSIQYSYG